MERTLITVIKYSELFNFCDSPDKLNGDFILYYSDLFACYEIKQHLGDNLKMYYFCTFHLKTVDRERFFSHFRKLGP